MLIIFLALIFSMALSADADTIQRKISPRVWVAGRPEIAGTPGHWKYVRTDPNMPDGEYHPPSKKIAANDIPDGEYHKPGSKKNENIPDGEYHPPAAGGKKKETMNRVWIPGTPGHAASPGYWIQYDDGNGIGVETGERRIYVPATPDIPGQIGYFFIPPNDKSYKVDKEQPAFWIPDKTDGHFNGKLCRGDSKIAPPPGSWKPGKAGTSDAGALIPAVPGVPGYQPYWISADPESSPLPGYYTNGARGSKDEGKLVPADPRNGKIQPGWAPGNPRSPNAHKLVPVRPERHPIWIPGKAPTPPRPGGWVYVDCLGGATNTTKVLPNGKYGQSAASPNCPA